MADKIELREAENQSVVGRIPSWIVRWGNLIILVICVILLILAFYLKFPVIVQGQVHISKENIYVIIPGIKQNLVKPNQMVCLRMDDYPYIDYGILEGKVSSIYHIINEDNKTYIPIELLDNKNSVSQSNLTPGMQGSGEITVENNPLIYRIIKTNMPTIFKTK